MLGYIDPTTGFTLTTAGGWLLAWILGGLGFFWLYFKKHWKRMFWFLLALAVLGGIIMGVLMNKNVQSNIKNKIVILGFDGLSPEILEPLMAQGKLPHFQKLKEKGSYSHLATTNPPQSPVAWASFATGKNPGETGVYDFIVRDPKTYELKLGLSAMKDGKPQRVVRAPSFWQVLSEKGVPCVILGCPITFPPDKIKGRMLSGMGTPDILGTEGTFSFYTSEKLDQTPKDVGGNVFSLRRSDTMVTHILGPKLASAKGAENVKVPMSIRVQGSDKVEIQYQGHKTALETKKWSGWQEVEFPLGLLKKAKGIFRFYLVSTEPDLKLYMSPINFDPRSPLFPISYPENYSKELANKIGLFYTAGMPMDTWAVNEGRLSEEAFIEQVRFVFEEKKKMLDYELGRFNKGLLFFYLECPDIVQHMFWRFTDPSSPMYDANAPDWQKNMIRDWYIQLDDIVGKVMQTLGDEDTLIVMSDHGMTSFRRAVNINTWLKENGYLFLNNNASEGGELLADVDWSRTKAYAIGFGALYLNLAGREGEGIVQPGQEAEALKTELIEKLAVIKDGPTGDQVIHKTYRRDEIFRGRYADETPDLYIGFKPGYRASWQTALGATPTTLIEDNKKKWAGDHLIDPSYIPGIIFINNKLWGQVFSIDKIFDGIFDMWVAKRK